MAAVFHGSTAQGGTTAALVDINVAYPAGVAAGDKAVLIHFGAEASGIPNVPGGTGGGDGTKFKLLGTHTFSTSFHARAWWADLDGTETGTFLLDSSNSTQRQAILGVWRGVAAGAPVIQWLSDSANPLDYPDPTLSGPGALGLFWGVRGGGTPPTTVTGTPAGSTQREARFSTGTSPVSAGLFSRDGVAAGAVDAGAMSLSGTPNTILATVTFLDGEAGPPPLTGFQAHMWTGTELVPLETVVYS